MGPRSPEGKAARAIIASLDKSEVNVPAIAYMLHGQNHVIQTRLWKLFMWLVKYWAMDYDADNFNDDSVNVKTNAKRVYEQMDKYGQMFDI